MASLSKINGKYYLRYYVNKKQKKVALHTDSLQVAKEKKRQLEFAEAMGSDNPLPTRTSIPEVFEAYVQHIRATKVSFPQMTGAGNCYDNAVAESFFGTLKCELDEPFATRAIAHDKLFDYIEVFYNRQRLHWTLNDMSSAAYEAKPRAV